MVNETVSLVFWLEMEDFLGFSWLLLNLMLQLKIVDNRHVLNIKVELQQGMIGHLFLNGSILSNFVGGSFLCFELSVAKLFGEVRLHLKVFYLVYAVTRNGLICHLK